MVWTAVPPRPQSHILPINNHLLDEFYEKLLRLHHIYNFTMSCGGAKMAEPKLLSENRPGESLCKRNRAGSGLVWQKTLILNDITETGIVIT